MKETNRGSGGKHQRYGLSLSQGPRALLAMATVAHSAGREDRDFSAGLGERWKGSDRLQLSIRARKFPVCCIRDVVTRLINRRKRTEQNIACTRPSPNRCACENIYSAWFFSYLILGLFLFVWMLGIIVHLYWVWVCGYWLLLYALFTFGTEFVGSRVTNFKFYVWLIRLWLAFPLTLLLFWHQGKG